jgi:hypothetical protein
MCFDLVVEPLHSTDCFVECILTFALRKEGSGIYVLHKPGSPTRILKFIIYLSG